jgi:hypothetical protein
MPNSLVIEGTVPDDKSAGHIFKGCRVNVKKVLYDSVR